MLALVKLMELTVDDGLNDVLLADRVCVCCVVCCGATRLDDWKVISCGFAPIPSRKKHWCNGTTPDCKSHIGCPELIILVLCNSSSLGAIALRSKFLLQAHTCLPAMALACFRFFIQLLLRQTKTIVCTRIAIWA